MKKINKETVSKGTNETQVNLQELDDRILKGIAAGAVPPKP
ncbi:hypothetical protein [Kamptonema sp. UHCC 0994]|nr:hypothetical protein [Kamptonema sp. UHCC 0994]MDF0555525.1 hypothetical protein [Kamptonema sp. UHCC 0994]